MKKPRNLIRLMKSIFVCKKTGHDLVDAGSCPFTGGTYKYCTRCNIMIRL